MSTRLKAIYRLNAIPIKVPMTYFTGAKQTSQNFIWNHKWPQIAAAILRKKNKVGEIAIPDIKLYYKVTGVYALWHWHKDRNIDQWNRIFSPEINLSLYGQLIFHKRGRWIKYNKSRLFNKWYWGSWTATSKKNETWSSTYTIRKNKFKVDKRLKYKLYMIKLHEENIGRKISLFHESILSPICPLEQGTKRKE